MSKDNVSPIIIGSKAKVVPSFSPVEALKFMTISLVKDSKKKSDTVHYHVSDTFLLLNQERLSKYLGADTYSAYIRMMSQQIPSSTSQLEQRLTDAERLSIVKSRYLQSPCEVQQWVRDLDSRFRDILDASVSSLDNSSTSSGGSQTEVAIPTPSPTPSN